MMQVSGAVLEHKSDGPLWAPVKAEQADPATASAA
jgi:hypothetical protein